MVTKMSDKMDFKIGKIESVSCENFVTYNKCTFKPKKHLNVIIGPNGSGKSTLVAAIVLGLGGDPKLLSRASAIESYIKNGKEDARIRIKIYVNNVDQLKTFQRGFGKDGKSEYKVDDVSLTRIKFLSAVAAYNIQISNLCQFLPQDRVQDFAKMNPQEILRNTLTSACSETIMQQFEKLLDLQKVHTTEENNLQKNKLQLQEISKRVEELQVILESYNAQKEHVKKLAVCEAKLAWMTVDELQKTVDEGNQDLERANTLLKRQVAQHAELLSRLKVVENTEKVYQNDLSKQTLAEQRILDEKSNVCDQIEELYRKVNDAKRDFEKESNDFDERQQELARENRVMQIIIADSDKVKAEINAEQSDMQSVEKLLQQYRVNVTKYRDERSQVNQKLDDEYTPELTRLRQHIASAENVKERTLQMMRDQFQDQYEAVQWLRMHGDIFRGKIYEPMILELNVRDANHAKYVENTIPIQDLLAFTCEHKADISLLRTELCKKRKLKISVLHSAAADQCLFKADEPIESLHSYGFTAYLLDLIAGPAPILNYLCSLYKLHEIPIGNEAVAKQTDHINHRLFFGDDQRYSVAISKYGNRTKSLLQSSIRSKKMLSCVNMLEVQSLKKRYDDLVRQSDALKNKRTQLEAQINEIEHNSNAAKAQKRTYQIKLGAFEQYQQKIQLQKQKIKHIKENIVSIPEMKQQFLATAKFCLQRVIVLQQQKILVCQSFQQVIAVKECAEARLNIYKLENEPIQEEMDTATNFLRDSQKIVLTIEKSIEQSKQKYKRKLAAAMEKTNQHEPTHAEYVFKELYEQLPNTKDELMEVINDSNARLECMGDMDQRVIEEHRTKSDEVEQLKEAITRGQHDSEGVSEEVTAIYDSWYPEVERVVQSLNEHFVDYMHSMAYVGEVLLHSRDKYDFESYGIRIMVQFRPNMPMQALNRNVQSGGERAVAIAVYTLSMQHLTNVPFRCVDEINQGMDPNNERKIFEMLLKETTKPGLSQYFFVTPKMLEHLPCNDRMAVHIVKNGENLTSFGAAPTF